MSDLTLKVGFDPAGPLALLPSPRAVEQVFSSGYSSPRLTRRGDDDLRRTFSCFTSLRGDLVLFLCLVRVLERGATSIGATRTSLAGKEVTFLSSRAVGLGSFLSASEAPLEGCFCSASEGCFQLGSSNTIGVGLIS